MLAFIFYMSSRSGNDIDHNTGIFSAIKEWLSVQALALFGREVDVSPVGHFCEYLALGAALANALRFHLKPEGAAGALLVAQPIDALSKWRPPLPQRFQACTASPTSSIRYSPPDAAATLWTGLSTP